MRSVIATLLCGCSVAGVLAPRSARAQGGGPADFVVDALEIDRFKQTIRDLSDLGTRYWSRPENTTAVEYIREKLESFGYENVTLDPYMFDGQLRHNVYATKIGTLRPVEMYILGAHLVARTGNSGTDRCRMLRPSRHR